MKRNLYIMYLVAFFQGLVFYGPVSLLFRINRGLTVSQFFFLEFIVLALIVLAEVPWGYFADKYGYKKTLIISYIIFFLGRLTLLLSNSFIDFFIHSVLTGIGLAGASGCDIAFLYDACNQEESEKTFGRYSAFGRVAFFISSLMSFFLVSISMDFAVFITVIAYGVSIIIICFAQDTCKHKNPEEKDVSIKECLKDLKNVKYIFIFVLSMALINEMCYGINVNLGQLQFKNIGINIAYLGYISAFSEVLGMLSCKTYVLSNKFGQYKTLKFLMLLMLLCVSSLIFTNDLFVSIIAVSGLGGLIAIAGPIVLDIKNKSINKNRATVLSIYSMLGNILAAFTNILIGFCADIYIKYAFLTCFVIMGIGVIGIYLYISKISLKDRSI